MTVAVVLDDHALRVFPGLDADLARAGALVMRSFKNTPNPQLLRRHAGVGVVGGPDRAGLLDRLERATTTLAGVPAPVIGILPPGVAAARELLGPGVVDLVPAGTVGVAERILLMAKVPVVTGARARARPVRSPAAPVLAPSPAAPRSDAPEAPPPGRVVPRPLPSTPAGAPVDVVAVASSTGGVWVLGALLRDLRGDVAVLCAQHMDAEFVPFFAEWLEGCSGWRVELVDGEAPLQPGTAYVAAGGRDLVLAEGDRVRALPSSSRYVPSADRLLTSAARAGRRTTGVVLSGMGNDGAAGLAEVLRQGGRALCQLPSSAVVPSMPEAALRAAPGALPIPPDALAGTLSAQRAARA